MTVVRFNGGKVSVEISVASPRSVPGSRLRDAYLEDIRKLTLGLVRARADSLYIGPLELLRFGPAKVTPDAVEWAIEGGIAARRPGGRFRIESVEGRLVASVDGYRPLLPLPLYVVTQLAVHRVITRLYLLRVRGREPAPGIRARHEDRLRAAAVDLAFCATLAGLIGRRRRLGALLGITAGYHLACWTLSGRTLGGLVMGQRVVSVDGSRPSLGQAAVRLVTLQDELAGTDVVID
jgi:hypothetical protein